MSESSDLFCQQLRQVWNESNRRYGMDTKRSYESSRRLPKAGKTLLVSRNGFTKYKRAPCFGLTLHPRACPQGWKEGSGQSREKCSIHDICSQGVGDGAQSEKAGKKGKGKRLCRLIFNDAYRVYLCVRRWNIATKICKYYQRQNTWDA